MPTWSAAVTDDGHWYNGALSQHDTVSVSRARLGGFRFANVPVPAGVTVTSATFSFLRTSGSGSRSIWTYLFDVDHMSALVDGQDSLPGTQVSETVTEEGIGTTYVFDVTNQVASVLSRTGWQEGNALGVGATNDTISSTAFHSVRDTDGPPAALTIEYVSPVQHLTPVTAWGEGWAAPVVIEQSITPVTAWAEAWTGAVEVIAPRILHPATTWAGGWTGVPGLSGTGNAPDLDVAGTTWGEGFTGTPLLSVTVAEPPPPPPWQRLVATPEYAAALASREPLTDARVEVIAPDDAIVATLGGRNVTHPGVVTGTVSYTRASAIRWTCDLGIDNADLIPESHHDLLHPLAHNRVRVWWMIHLGLGVWGEVPVGTYYLDWPAIADTGEGDVAMSVAGSDAVAELARNTWDQTLDVSGLNAAEAVRRIIEDRAPWATTSITTTDHTLPSEWEAGEPGGNPVDDIVAIAQAAGMEFYADRMGTLTLADKPDPLAAARAAFIEGPECLMTEVSAQVDLDQIANRVTVTSSGRLEDASGNELPPVTAAMEDTDPTSPLWVGHGHIYHRRIESDTIQTQEQADQMARDLLDEYRALVDQVELVVFAHPHLDGGDVVDISAERARITGSRQVQSWSLALGDMSGQRITTTGRRGLT